MDAIDKLEKRLNEVFVDSAPALPPSIVKFIVRFLPWVNLLLGIFTFYAVWVLWHWAHYAQTVINYANQLNSAYGTNLMPIDRMSFGLWLAMGFLLIEGTIYVLAFPATRARQKRGWDLMFYAALINIIYCVIVVFTSYGSFGGLLFNLVGAAIGLYFLFQIRASYLKKASAKAGAIGKKRISGKKSNSKKG